jgi:hypothetical protein
VSALKEEDMSRYTLTLFAALFITGCAAPSNVQKIDRLDAVGENPRIILMPPDIRYYLLTAGGAPEPNAEWTTAAQENFQTAAIQYANSIGADLTPVHKDNLSEEEIRYEALHSAVGMSLLTHHFGYLKLPGKAGRFDWSLGPDIDTLAKNHNADYALFVFYRDYQASGGRVAFAVLAAAAGVGVGVGSESGFASLVDLKTGDIVWFNQVVAGSGELRDVDGAATAVEKLFAGIPTRQGRADSE